MRLASVERPHVAKADLADATAALTSSTEAKSTVLVISPVAGS